MAVPGQSPYESLLSKQSQARRREEHQDAEVSLS